MSYGKDQQINTLRNAVLGASNIMYHAEGIIRFMETRIKEHDPEALEIGSMGKYIEGFIERLSLLKVEYKQLYTETKL